MNIEAAQHLVEAIAGIALSIQHLSKVGAGRAFLGLDI